MNLSTHTNYIPTPTVLPVLVLPSSTNKRNKKNKKIKELRKLITKIN